MKGYLLPDILSVDKKRKKKLTEKHISSNEAEENPETTIEASKKRKKKHKHKKKKNQLDNEENVHMPIDKKEKKIKLKEQCEMFDNEQNQKHVEDSELTLGNCEDDVSESRLKLKKRKLKEQCERSDNKEMQENIEAIKCTSGAFSTENNCNDMQEKKPKAKRKKRKHEPQCEGLNDIQMQESVKTVELNSDNCKDVLERKPKGKKKKLTEQCQGLDDMQMTENIKTVELDSDNYKGKRTLKDKKKRKVEEQFEKSNDKSVKKDTEAIEPSVDKCKGDVLEKRSEVKKMKRIKEDAEKPASIDLETQNGGKRGKKSKKEKSQMCLSNNGSETSTEGNQLSTISTKDSAIHHKSRHSNVSNEQSSSVDETKRKKNKKTKDLAEDDHNSTDFKVSKDIDVNKTHDSSTEENCLQSSQGQWQGNLFESSERQNKFLRLLGGMKKSTTNEGAGGVQNKLFSQTSTKKKGLFGSLTSMVNADSSGGNVALSATAAASLDQKLEDEYNRAMNFKLSRQTGTGLGFQRDPAAGKKFHIDIHKTKSIKFDD